MIPKDYHKWQLVYYYKKWVNRDDFDLLLTKLRELVRMKKGQNSEACLGIIDSQSVRWGNNRFLSSYDGNKKVKGIKRHVIVDKNGSLLAVMVSLASIHDSKAVLLLMGVVNHFLYNIKIIIADGGYRGDCIEQVKRSLDRLFK